MCSRPNPIRGRWICQVAYITAYAVGRRSIRPFQDADIGSQFLAKGPRQLRRSCGQLSYIHTYMPRHPSFSTSRWQKQNSSMQFPSLLPRRRDNPMTRAYTCPWALSSPLPPERNVAKRALRAQVVAHESMTWTTTWQSSADCRSGQLPVIYDLNALVEPNKNQGPAFPQHSDSTGPSAR
ncbi:hypothetical protein J3F84DRAFT_380048 [Trichoderma pleuroticola]